MRERIYRVLSQVMNVPIEQINDDTSPDNLEKWDSLKHLNLVLALEEEFQVQFNDGQVIEMLNVSLILHILEEMLMGKK